MNETTYQQVQALSRMTVGELRERYRCLRRGNEVVSQDFLQNRDRDDQTDARAGRPGDPVGGGRPGPPHRQPGELRPRGGHRRSWTGLESGIRRFAHQCAGPPAGRGGEPRPVLRGHPHPPGGRPGAAGLRSQGPAAARHPPESPSCRYRRRTSLPSGPPIRSRHGHTSARRGSHGQSQPPDRLPKKGTGAPWAPVYGELLTFDGPREARLPAIDRLEGFHPTVRVSTVGSWCRYVWITQEEWPLGHM